jgi:hypothetical protein
MNAEILMQIVQIILALSLPAAIIWLMYSHKQACQGEFKEAEQRRSNKERFGYAMDDWEIKRALDILQAQLQVENLIRWPNQATVSSDTQADIVPENARTKPRIK